MTNRISNVENPNSYTALSMVALIGMSGFLTNVPAIGTSNREEIMVHESINADSYDSYTQGLTRGWTPLFYHNELEKELSSLFSKLQAAQKPLGDKFEEVLFKNLWNLYDN